MSAPSQPTRRPSDERAAGGLGREPADPDRELAAYLHPPEWINPEPAPRYDLVVLGGGTAGVVGAEVAAAHGKRVALVESGMLGGARLATGSVPSKALLRTARAYADLRHAALFGAAAGEVTVDGARALSHMRCVRARISRRDGVARLVDLGVHVFFARAHFAAPDALALETPSRAPRTLRFEHALIATGARPLPLSIDGLAAAGFKTSESIFDLTELPRRLLVIGGGPLGCELGQAFQRLGSQVVIVQKEPMFLPREERDAARLLAEAFEEDGMLVRLNTDILGVTQRDGVKLARIKREDIEETLEVDEILAGVGRAPNVEGLGLDLAGVQVDPERGVVVDEHLRTTNAHIYAAGDVCLETKFTHMAEATGRLAVTNALALGHERLSTLTIPWCTYTDPEIAHVGLYVREARERKLAVETFTVPLTEVDRAVTEGEVCGFVKITVAAGTDHILGATIVSRDAGEMLSEITLAITENIGLRTLARVIHPYPTKGEAIRKAAEACCRARK